MKTKARPLAYGSRFRLYSSFPPLFSFYICSPHLSVSFPGVPVFSAATGTLIFLMAGRNGHQQPQVYVIMEVSPFLPSVPFA